MTQLRGLRRPSRAPSVSSINFPFPTTSPTPRFRAPYPHQRNISAFDNSKGNTPLTPGFSMDRTQQIQQPQSFQYQAQFTQQPQTQQQYPPQPAQRPPRYSSPVPPSMPPQQQQPPQQQSKYY